MKCNHKYTLADAGSIKQFRCEYCDEYFSKYPKPHENNDEHVGEHQELLFS